MTRICTVLAVMATTLTMFGQTPSASACPKCAKTDCCGPTCCYNSCIKYVDKSRCCRSCESSLKVQTVLQVKDPRTCCLVNVPVCIPACCMGEPCVDAKCGLLGNAKVFFSWNCGYELKIVLTKLGDITVVYLG